MNASHHPVLNVKEGVVSDEDLGDGLPAVHLHGHFQEGRPMPKAVDHVDHVDQALTLRLGPAGRAT